MNMKIRMEQSPFYVERNEEAKAKERKPLHTDVSPEVYNDVEEYIKQRGDDFNSSKFVKELAMDFLNTHAFEQKHFNNIGVILLMQKGVSPDELNEKAKVIGVLSDGFMIYGDFYGGGLFYPLRYNFMYTLREFNEAHYKSFIHQITIINHFKDNIFFNVDKRIQDDFESVKKRLSVLYDDIDIDDSYFVLFNVNNYLDIFKDGVYRSETSELEHEGVIVLLEDLLEGVFARIKWSYLQGEFSFSLTFEDVKDFEQKISHRLSNPDLIEDFNKMSKVVSKEGKVKYERKRLIGEIEYLKRALETKEQELKELDEEISQDGENTS